MADWMNRDTLHTSSNEILSSTSFHIASLHHSCQSNYEQDATYSAEPIMCTEKVDELTWGQ